MAFKLIMDQTTESYRSIIFFAICFGMRKIRRATNQKQNSEQQQQTVAIEYSEKTIFFLFSLWLKR